MSAPADASWVASWAIAFAATIAVETPIATALLAPAEPRVARRAATAVLAQLVSHPAVWFLFPALGFAWETSTALSEAWAFASEVAFYRIALPSLTTNRAIVTSAVANAASFGVGLLVERLVR